MASNSRPPYTVQVGGEANPTDFQSHVRLAMEALGHTFWNAYDVGRRKLWISTRAGWTAQLPLDSFQEDFTRAAEYVHPEDREPLLTRMAQGWKDRQSIREEFRIVLPNGETRWALLHAVPLQDEAAPPNRLAGVLLDIDDRQRRLLARAQEDEAYRSAFENSRDAILWADMATGKIVNCNRRAEEMLERSRDEILGMHQTLIHPPGEEPLYREKFAEGIRTNRDIEGEVYTRSEQRIPVRIHGSQMKIGDRSVLQGLFIDMTEIKEAERKFQEASRFNQQLLDDAPIGLMAYDSSGACVTCSHAAANSIGATREQALAQNFRRIKSWRDSGLYEDAEKTLATGEETRRVIHTMSTFGRDIWLDCRFVRFERSGEPHLLLLFDDITEARRIQDERLAMEREMFNAQKLESLGVMAGGIAHDFNNFLTAVLGNIEVGQLDIPEGSPARAAMEEAARAARQAADVTRQMLAYTGKGISAIKPVSINALVEENVSFLRVSIPRNVTFRFIPEPDLPEMLVDPSQIHQVIMNLLTNAAEAIGEAPGEVMLRTGLLWASEALLQKSVTRHKPPEGRYISLEVSDNGCGLDPNLHARIFDPFITTKASGRGLGLAVVLGIVQGHNGALFLESTQGKGSLFRILLPAPEGRDAQPRQEDKASLLNPVMAPNATILIADDDPAVLNLASRMLQRLGYKTLTACDGEEAVQLFGKHAERIACILMDLTMPKMNGIAAYREIRRIDPNAKAILTSGYNEQDVIQRYVGQGLAGFLAKPYDLKKLGAELARVLGTDAGVPA